MPANRKGSLIGLFGRRVREMRRGRGMTLEELGRAAGIGYKHIAEIERGVKVPSFEAIGQLARALKAQPHELFLPERIGGGSSGDDNLHVLVSHLHRHGSPAMKQFVVEVLTAARMLAAASGK